MRFPPKQPTVPLMPRTNPPNNIIHLDDNTPLILDNRVIGVCKKKDTGCVECIIWDRNLTFEYMPDKNNVADSVVINVNKERLNVQTDNHSKKRPEYECWQTRSSSISRKYGFPDKCYS